MKTDPVKSKEQDQAIDKPMANLAVPQSEKAVGADSLTANPLPPSTLTPQEQQELDTQRQQPFALTEANPTGKPLEKEKEPVPTEPKAEPRQVPKGRMIADSVGRGGKNNPHDMKAVSQKLAALGIISQEQALAAQNDPETLGNAIETYQKRVFNTVKDGLISAGGTTETRLIQGIVTKAGKTREKTSGEKPTPMHPGQAPAPEKKAPNYAEAAKKLYEKGFSSFILGTTMAGSHAEIQLVAAMFALIPVNSQDNFAVAYCAGLSEDGLKNLPIQMKIAFFQAMKGGFVGPDEIAQIYRLGKSLGVKEESVKKQSQKTGDATKKPEQEPKEVQQGIDADGWSIGPLLSVKDYYSQLHPDQVNGVKSIPRNIAFSGALTHYDKGGKQDIYNEATVKKNWKGLSIKEREYQVYKYACKNTCSFILKNSGFQDSSSASTIQTLMEQKVAGGMERIATEKFDEGKNRLDLLLETGVPVLVGVDRQIVGANTSATDHFIIIVGRGIDENGKYYSFFDVGRGHAAGYDLARNKLYNQKDLQGNENAKQISGIIPKGGSLNKYTLSEVRNVTKIK